MYTTGVKIQGSVTVAQTEPKKSGVKIQGSGACCMSGLTIDVRLYKIQGPVVQRLISA